MPITTTTGLALAKLPYPIPSYGVGLNWMSNSATTIKLYSNHDTQNCYVPMTNGLGDDLTVKFTPDSSAGMTLDIATNGANGLDTGSVAATTFYQVRAISKGSGDVALLAHTNGKLTYGGTAFTMPSGYTHYSDILWGFSCSTDFTEPYDTFDDIVYFQQTGPGRCRYTVGYGENPGAGIQVLSDGDASSESAAIGLSAAAHAVSRGQTFIQAHALTADSSATTCQLYYSGDGRTTSDANQEEALEVLASFRSVGTGSGMSTAQELSVVVPNNGYTTDGTMGYTTSATGTASNILQYQWADARTGRELDVYVTGWQL